MRYYNIKIFAPGSDTNVIAQWSTLNPDGSNNPRALKVEIDILQGVLHEPSQNGILTIYGVPFSQLGQAADFNGANITVEVGMLTGLPLANPKNNGRILTGQVLQAYGNWQGTSVNLNLVVIPYSINPNEQANLAFNWQKGQTLGDAVSNTLKTAYPLAVNGAFSNSLVNTENQPGMYFTVKSFAQYVNQISQYIINDPAYLGASIGLNNEGFVLIDGTVADTPTIATQFADLIGNLTWINVATIQAKLVMRDQITVGDNITFPAGAPTVNSAVQFNQIRNAISFDGTFQVLKIRHVGSSRQADANSWCTIVDCVMNNATVKP